ncbi:hypothetical protein RFI_37170, partial [Reticulomyxa filosa]
PTIAPTKQPTESPTKRPTTKQPTVAPTKRPTIIPTKQPTTKQPTKQPTTKQPTKKPTNRPTLSTYTCNGNKFSGDFSQETTSTAYFNAESATNVAYFSMCVSGTQAKIEISNPAGSYFSEEFDDCNSSSLILPASSNYYYTVDVTYVGGTEQAWTLDIVCVAQRRLQSSTSLKLANSVTFIKEIHTLINLIRQHL